MQFSFTKIFYLINAILLCLAIGFVAFFVTLQVKPKLINSYGKEWVKNYIDHGVKQANVAVSSLKADDTAPAQTLLEDWHDIAKSDRLYPQKRRVFLELTKYWNAHKGYEKTLQLAPEYMLEDERDIAYFNRWVVAALNVDEFKDQAKTDLTDMWERFPMSEDISQIYVKNVLDLNDRAKTLEVIEKINLNKARGLKKNGWVVYWTDAEAFKRDQKAQVSIVKDGEFWRIDTQISPQTKQIRVDLPANNIMNISEIRLQSGKNIVEYDINKLTRMKLMSVVDGRLLTTGVDRPHFVIDIENGPPIKSVRKTKISVYMRLSREIPEWYQALEASVEQ